MNEFLTVLVEHLTIWAPSVVAILTIVATIIPVCLKIREYLKGLKEDKTMSDIAKKLATVSADNEELIRCNKLLLDEITKIQGYADNMKED